jgi:hypothetical protein
MQCGTPVPLQQEHEAPHDRLEAEPPAMLAGQVVRQCLGQRAAATA